MNGCFFPIARSLSAGQQVHLRMVLGVMIRLFVMKSAPVEKMDESATSRHEQDPFNG